MEIVNTAPNFLTFVLSVIIGALVGLVIGFNIEKDPLDKYFTALICAAIVAMIFALVSGGAIRYSMQDRENSGTEEFEQHFNVTIEDGEIPTTRDPDATLIEVTSTEFSGKSYCIVSVEADTYVLTCP